MSIVAQMARFGHALRASGARLSAADEIDGLTALTLVDIGDRDEVAHALRAALKIQPGDLATFEALFARMWAGDLRDERAARGTSEHKRAATRVREREVPEGDEPSYSPAAVLRRKPFDECTPEDLASMERLMRQIARRVATRPSRRRIPVRGTGEIDLRRSLRRAVRYGGELVSFAHRDRAIERPQLLVLADTSASMDPHARFFLAFVRALRRVARATEVFVFNTSLSRLAETQEHDWSSGTRIGECLAEFADRYLGALVDRRTVVLILSDGLDLGDVGPLAAAMQAIHARARRVLWLNPLAGDERYEPTARAMAAALPYVDRLLPAHNLESLERLVWAFR